jgi:hypothetical protein
VQGERADNTCEYCGKVYTKGHGLHAAHFESRGNWATRFEPLNIFALCYFHHQQLDGSPIKFREFYILKRGIEKLEILTELSRDLMRGKENRKQKKEIAEYYHDVYLEMLLKRSYGMTGWLDFVGFN